jgi:hypothetical protein
MAIEVACLSVLVLIRTHDEGVKRVYINSAKVNYGYIRSTYFPVFLYHRAYAIRLYVNVLQIRPTGLYLEGRATSPSGFPAGLSIFLAGGCYYLLLLLTVMKHVNF